MFLIKTQGTANIFLGKTPKLPSPPPPKKRRSFPKHLFDDSEKHSWRSMTYIRSHSLIPVINSSLLYRLKCIYFQRVKECSESEIRHDSYIINDKSDLIFQKDRTRIHHIQNAIKKFPKQQLLLLELQMALAHSLLHFD